MPTQNRTILFCVLAIVTVNVGIYVAVRKIRSARHSIEGDVQVFRYTPIVAWAYIIGPLLLGIVAYYFAFGPTLSPSVESKSAVAISVLSICLLSLVGVWYRSFSITINGSAIYVRSIFRQGTTQFSDLQKILVTGNPGRTLVVTNRAGKRVLSAYDDLQDFADLIYLLKVKGAHTMSKHEGPVGEMVRYLSTYYLNAAVGSNQSLERTRGASSLSVGGSRRCG